jgi:PDZ domain-containing protein
VVRAFSPGRLLTAGVVLLAVVAGVLWLAPSNSFLLLPDQAHPVAPLVTVAHPKADRNGGAIYFVDVIERKASLLERLFPGIRKGSTLVPASALLPPGSSESAAHTQDLRAMARSQEIAAAVALRELGYKVDARPIGVLVSAVASGEPAAGKLQPTDIVTAVDGHPVQTPDQLRSLIGRHRPGESVRLTVRRGSQLKDITVKTVPDAQDPKRPVVGILVDQAVSIHLPVPVSIDAGGVGGPSAGLAFALEVMEKLGRDVDQGCRVAATGEMQLDGTVAPIGGIKQKVIGAREAHVDVFLVPAGENAQDALKEAHGLRIIPVQTFRQALRALATLRGKC